MEVGAEILAEEQMITAEIFDRLAGAYRTGEHIHDLRSRAVAAACIVAFNQENNHWYDVLDTAMFDRDLPTTFSKLNPAEQRYHLRTAMHDAGQLTTRSKTLLQELRALNADIS
jgi:hypothetical protein